MYNSTKNIIFSGIQPSGSVTLGNYCGTMSRWKSLSEIYQCFFCIADLHALTVFSKKKKCFLYKNILDMLSIFLSCGITPEKSVIFVQSNVYEHSLLYWILGNFCKFGELSRMTQFKKKNLSLKSNPQLSLFSYPVLMAADILLYKTNFVPVGQDQKQHIELVQVIAKRFNAIYGDVFSIPKPLISKIGNKIMSLKNPNLKMSKSDSDQNGCIYLLDNIKSVSLKLNQAVTDSDDPACIKYDKYNKPGISNLLSIFSAISGKDIFKLELEFQNVTYKYFKKILIDLICDFLSDFQKSFIYYRKKENYLRDILKFGAIQATQKSQMILGKIFKILY